MEDKTRTDREKKQRHDYYMERAAQAKRAELVRLPDISPTIKRGKKS